MGLVQPLLKISEKFGEWIWHNELSRKLGSGDMKKTWKRREIAYTMKCYNLLEIIDGIHISKSLEKD